MKSDGMAITQACYDISVGAIKTEDRQKIKSLEVLIEACRGRWIVARD